MAAAQVTPHDLESAVRHFEGWAYRSGDGHYPNQLPGVRLPRPPPRHTDCCCFAEYVIVHAAKCDWSLTLHRQMMIQGPDRFSPVQAVIDAGLAEEFEGVPSSWTLCQGWRDKWRSGHTFIVVEGGPGAEDKCLILDAGLAGIGYRGVGGARSLVRPGKPWRLGTNWTWAKILREFPNLRAGRLLVE